MSTDAIDPLDRARAAIVVAFIRKRGSWAALKPKDCARLDALADDYLRERRRFEQELGLIPDDDGEEEIAPADDGPVEPIVADVLPGEYEAAGVAVAMMREPKIAAVVAEVLAVDVSEEGIDPEGDDYALRLVQRINAWMDSDDETIAGRRAALLECAAVALAGIVACDAKGSA